MRGDPADPLAAARSLIDYVSCIIMLYDHDRRPMRDLYNTMGTLQETTGDYIGLRQTNGRSPVIIYDSLL
jgi:hypothetical protein